MENKVLTVCPYCGAGCRLYLVVEDGKIKRAEPAMGRTNEGELCLKGYYGWDYLNDPKLLTPRIRKPKIRKNGKLEEVTWDEAISFTAKRLGEIRDKYGADSIMGTGCSRGPGNEANYIMQKFMRAVIGTNNVDNCARVCHGPSVAGLAKVLGNGAMSNSIPEIDNADLVFIFGYNPAESHPMVARRIVKARQKGAKIVVVDPRVTESVRISDLWLPIKGGTNMALVNGFANVLINEGLYNKDYVEKYTEGFDEYIKVIKKYTPEYVEKIVNVPAEKIKKAMEMYASAKNPMILYGMGVCQFGQAVDVVKGLAGLALLTGNYGRPSVGIGPVRGQNNVQGACDMGALPNNFPGYQSVTDKNVREKFEKAWGVKNLPDKIGYHLTEVPKAVLEEHKLKAYYIMGEDCVQSDPNSNEVREALDELEFVVVQDIFMNKTTLHADVILPATAWGEHEGVYSAADRGLQKFNKAVEPIGEAKPDWQIICELSSAMGYKMHYNNTKEIWDEMRSLSPKFAGATYEKMETLDGVLWPCPTEDHPGTPVLYENNEFSTPSKKGILFASEWRPTEESPDEKYPLSLCTVREIGHYSVRTMTGNCRALQQLEDEPGKIQMSIEDAEELGIKTGDLVRVSSKRDSVVTRANVTDRVLKGATYMTYQWWIGACNELTVDNLDPISKTPEYKYCAVKVEAIEDQDKAEKYIDDTYKALREKLGIVTAN
ncbi:formate dehydrogenase subunit alpha [Clostridium coskatii]|uniref:Formate dehydrogenase H n=1 Tax=Clostridium coskatii TaxID=1705578 RepID=A0A166TER6_9CLOT|nr:formate dehydrogenase subunit alpha [Clostridium coskatii]OAA93590.1 Formate dehydrogenase H [Clostridium coskatii]OBR94435.1 formate dehydrogenase H [Clostridium coskatii]